LDKLVPDANVGRGQARQDFVDNGRNGPIDVL
jgi:hypothetical protein